MTEKYTYDEMYDEMAPLKTWRWFDGTESTEGL